MKLAIIGYGRMGHMIEDIAKKRGHKIVCVIDVDNPDDFNSEAYRGADVAIEFTTPGTAVDNILKSFAAEVPVVCGTTGWLTALPELKDLCDKGKGTLLYASNFSIGVNVFMAVNRYLARIMDEFPQYAPSMTEIHHIHKLDHPSGTAITLAEDIVERVTRLDCWDEPEDGKELKKNALPIEHKREGEVPGTHIINWDSPADTITITHRAKSREGFALGAVMAAEWLKGKKGYHTISDMLSDVTHTTGIF